MSPALRNLVGPRISGKSPTRHFEVTRYGRFPARIARKQQRLRFASMPGLEQVHVADCTRRHRETSVNKASDGLHEDTK
ncbi:hypothetical protein M419DRAFT_79255 [Trichoderma reesei RUT C-30]|nr:hypothetical protein M419DRAFT_79255 [Trichoderma reesei RUT C-30]